MKSKIIILLLVAALPFLAKSQTMVITKSATLTLDTNNVGLSPRAMFDIIADTNWCDAQCVLKITDYTINGEDSLILDAGGVGSVLHIWLDSTSTDTNFSANLEIKEVWLTEVATDASAKKGAWLLVNSSAAVRAITPPSNPRPGDWFGVIDSRASATTNNITIDTSTDKLNSAASDYVMSANYEVVILEYRNSTLGWVKKN
jgi:hypothetical protein